MSSINSVVLIGRLTRDAEFKQLENSCVSNFSLAVDRRTKQNGEWVDTVDFFDIALWGKQAETLRQYLVKGKQIAIDGELRQDRWLQDGQSRSKVMVVANNIQLLGGNGGQKQPESERHDNGFTPGKAW